MKTKRKFYNIAILLLAAFFLFCTCQVADYFLESKVQQEQFADLASQVEELRQQEQSISSPDSSAETPGGSSEADTPATESEPSEEDGILAEYAALYETNTDLIGWLKINNTKINYPVMHKPDIKDYYLRRDFYGKYSSHGCLYVREECDVFAPSDNITIYGHNMRDDSMFGELDKFTNDSFWEENGIFTFDTLTGHHTYQVFAVFKTTSNADTGFAYHQFVNGTEDEFDSFITTCKTNAFYDTGITPEFGDKILCLSTCEYSQQNGRLVVAAVRIS